MSLISSVKTALLRAGFEVSRLGASSSDRALTVKLIEFSGATAVIDVGANTGQFAQQLLSVKPSMAIISFEPLSSAHAILTKNAARAKNWKVADRIALGARSAGMKINIASNSTSSSLRKMKNAHLTAAPESHYVGEEDVEVKRLDEVKVGFDGPLEKIYLKIDAQGYEAEVLSGAEGVLPKVVALQIEASIIELYSGEMLAPALIRSAEELGFRLFAVSNGFRNPDTGELLQVDLYFIRVIDRLREAEKRVALF